MRPAGDGVSRGHGRIDTREILLRYSNDAVLLFDERARIIDCNDRAVEMFGYLRDDLLGKSITDLRVAEGDIPLDERLADHRATGDAGHVFEGRARRCDGSIISVEVGVRTVETRAGLVFHATIRDISERKAVEEALREREQSYRAIFHESPYAMALMTYESAIVDANQGFFDMISATREETLGRTVVELGIADEEAVEAIAALVRRDGAVRDLELARVSRTGVPFVVSMNLSPVTLADQDYVLAIYRDVTRQKRAEAEAREGRAKLDAAFASMTDAVYVFDADGTLVDFNDAFVTFHRFSSREECVRRLAEYSAITEVFTPDGEPVPAESWPTARALRGEVGTDQELTLRRTDTGEAWQGSFSFAPLRDGGGELTGAVVVARDITERKRADAALRESEAAARETVERLSRAQRLGHIGDWEWEVATGEVRWSDEVYRIYGVEPDFPTRFDTIVPMVHPDDRDDDLRGAAEIISDTARTSGLLRFRIVRPDGAVRHILQTLSVERDEAGTATRVFGLQQDITELHETEEALIQSERSLRRFYDAGLIGVAYWTVTGGFTDANDRFLDMLGYSRTELETGQVDWARMTPPEWEALDRMALEELRTVGRNAVPYEKEYYRKDGSRIPVLIAAAALDDEGKAGIALVLDVSEQRAAADELRRLNTELEERVRRRTADLEAANAELESFAYSVSHDLRAPLRHISAFATLLGEKLADGDEESGHFIERITASAADMSELIDDLLKFSRVGRAEMHVEIVDMDDLVRQVLEIEDSERGERRVEVEVEALAPAVGDAALLRQVWANLIGNAYKYTRPRDPAVIAVGSRMQDHEVVYWVRDNGVGFDMQYADRLFRVFERLHRSDEFEGTGIGLANVQRIVGRHAGRCWAESETGAGSTFYFTLPRG